MTTIVKISKYSFLELNPPPNNEEIKTIQNRIPNIDDPVSIILHPFRSLCGDGNCDHKHEHSLKKPLSDFLNGLPKKDKDECIRNLFVLMNREELTIDHIQRLINTQNICSPEQWKEEFNNLGKNEYFCVRPECKGACGKEFDPKNAKPATQKKETKFNFQKNGLPLMAGLASALAIGGLLYLALSPSKQNKDNDINLASSLAQLSSLPLNKMPANRQGLSQNKSLTALQELSQLNS